MEVGLESGGAPRQLQMVKMGLMMPLPPMLLLLMLPPPLLLLRKTILKFGGESLSWRRGVPTSLTSS
jgi:hypothetical protein